MNQINHRHTRAFATQLLQSLKTRMNSVPNTGYTAFAKTLSLVYLNCSYERFICIPEDLKNHPYEMLEELVQKTHAFFEC